MKNQISWQVTILPIVFIILTAGIFSFFSVYDLQKDKRALTQKATADFISQQKKTAKNRVMTAVELVRFQSARTHELVRRRVKDRVDEAIHIASAFHKKYHQSLPEKVLKEQIKLILSEAVFDHPDGYFFAVDMNTEKIIVHKLDKLLGHSMSQHKDLRGQFILTEQKNLLAHSDGAFQTIYFSKPTYPDREFPKQLYVRYFKPFNWLIGTGEYIDDMEKRLKADVLNSLKFLYTGKNEHLFVHEIYNLHGDDDKPFGQVLLSGNPKNPVNQPLFSTAQDSKGNFYREEILQLLRNHGEGYSSYWYPSPIDSQETKRTSFFFYDKDWGWTIGSGFYYNFLNEKLAEIEQAIDEKIAKKIWLSIAMTLLITAIMTSVFLLLSRRISRIINKYSAELQQAQKMESIGRLAGGVAHDFNNMLSVIIGYADLLLLKISTSDSKYKPINEIRNAAKRSAEITRQLLAFSRQEVISPRALDLNQCVDQHISMVKRLIGEDITLEWHPGSDLWPVLMDSSQFSQIIINLCVNARDAIENVGIISVETRKTTLDKKTLLRHSELTPGDYVVLSISDTGSGMDRKTIENLFEPFFTTKENGKGTGLGLATVYGILKQNNCFIDAYSELGKGSTFNLYFPKHTLKTEDKAVKKPLDQNIEGTETILLVEDEEAVLNMSTLLLQDLGYTVLACNSPEKAIQVAENSGSAIDLLMTDVVMPGMNGKEISEKLQTLYPGLKMLFVSGYTANVIADRGVLGEGVNFIQKPFSKHDLGLKLKEVLSDSYSTKK